MRSFLAEQIDEGEWRTLPLHDCVTIPPMKNLILASNSPRRKELLGLLGWPFEVIPADIDEVSKAG